ncbi:Mitochondrial carrier domain superfamily [Fusarium oxysporum f. sp. vasinfectum]|nr:Mitochondrial carrier domain superfamily [Fusarium oxysporum f. sp. vasinfectum]
MGSDIKDTVWPDHPVPNSVKNLIHRFFELLDSQDTNVGNILADEIFAPDARAQFGAHVFTGTEVKVRMQMVPHEAKQSLLRTSLAIVQDEGVRGLYSGLSAGLTRALTYGAVRIGVYEELKQQAVTNGFGTASHLLIPIAFASGFAGAILGTPSDIANIRMQNDKSQPPQLRRNYRHVFHAWTQMRTQEGWRSFSQGMSANCFRCGVMTASQLACYDFFKGILRDQINRPDSTATHLTASLGASLVATSVASPMDVIRTHMMGPSSKPGVRASVWGILRHLVSTEGYRWVFRGWSSSFIRLGPQTIATLVTMEQQRKLYRAFVARQD